MSTASTTESPRSVAASLERRDALLAAVDELAAEFEANARQAELDRRLPQAVADRMRDADLFWMKTPLELGGTELHPLHFADVMERIAYHDISAAWATMIGNGTTGVMAGWLPEAGAADLFADDDRPITAGQFTPRGVAVPTEGGYRITGRWGFGSGIGHANWIVGAAIVEGTHDILFFAAPKTDATVYDTWHVAALQGTGSNDYSVDDLFVPEHRTMGAYGAVSTRDGHCFRMPISIFISNEISPMAVGIARRAIDDMVDLAKSTARSLTGVGDLIDRIPFQKALGQALAKWHAARALSRAATQEAYDIVDAGGVIDDDKVADLWARHTYVGELCEELVHDLFRYGGGRVLSLKSPMQRHARNLLGVLQHIHLSDEKFEFAGAAYIRERTGLDGVGDGRRATAG